MRLKDGVTACTYYKELLLTQVNMTYDNINIINKAFDFSGLNREATLFLPIGNLNSVTDLVFTFYTRPSYILASSPQNLGGGENFHFYLNGKDITVGIKKGLVKNLKLIDKDKLEQQYLQGAKTYCDYVTAFESYRDQYKNEFENAKNYIKGIDIEKTFEQIGSRKMGISGNLHIINFIYRFIEIKALSMDEVLADSGLSTAINYKKGNSIVIQVSQGPSPTLVGFDPSEYIPAGSIELNLNVQTVNPLEKPLKDIFNRLTQLQMQLENQRVNYLNPLYDVTAKIDTDLNLSSERILKELTQIETNISNL